MVSKKYMGLTTGILFTMGMGWTMGMESPFGCELGMENVDLAVSTGPGESP